MRMYGLEFDWDMGEGLSGCQFDLKMDVGVDLIYGCGYDLNLIHMWMLSGFGNGRECRFKFVTHVGVEWTVGLVRLSRG